MLASINIDSGEGSKDDKRSERDGMGHDGGYKNDEVDSSDDDFFDAQEDHT